MLFRSGEADPEAALAEELAAPGPSLIHVSIDVNQHVFPMVPPGAANRDMMITEASVPVDPVAAD